MANETIPDLPAATSLSGNEQIWAVQTGADVRITTSQIASLISLAGAALYAEQLTVSSLNTLTPLSFVPKNGIVMLSVDGAQLYFNVGAAASFNVVTQTVHWTSSTYDLQTTDTVYAIYGV